MSAVKHTPGTWGVGFLNDAWDEWQVDAPGSFTTVYIGDPGSGAEGARERTEVLWLNQAASERLDATRTQRSLGLHAPDRMETAL